MKLSIIIPVYNEEKTIQSVLHTLTRITLVGIKKEIIVVDDGSFDKTAQAIKLFQKKNNVMFIQHAHNKGKGAAIRSGLKKASGTYILIQDADEEYNPMEINKLLDPIMKKKAEIVYGTRLKRLPNFKRDERTLRFFIHYVGNKCLSLLTSLFYGQWITDMETGYKLIPRKILNELSLNSSGFEIEAEMTAKILKKKYRILEIPISTNPRNYAQGKKLNTVKDGIKALTALLRYRFDNG